MNLDDVKISSNKTKQHNDNCFVSGKVACSILGVHERTLHNWDKKNKIDVFRSSNNGKRFYNVDKFLKNNNNFLTNNQLVNQIENHDQLVDQIENHNQLINAIEDHVENNIENQNQLDNIENQNQLDNIENVNQLDNIKNENQNQIENNNKKKYCYVRVDSINQSKELKKRKKFLQNLYPNHIIIEDISIEYNYDRYGLNLIFELLLTNKIDELVIFNKKDIINLPNNNLTKIFKLLNCELIILNKSNDIIMCKQDLINYMIQYLNLIDKD
jgi:predicted site-specific integrase-resolvase